MDAFTAVAGSGPAYVFALAEAMIEAAVKAGIPRAQAEGMVTGTISGAAELLRQSGAPAGELRERVTSPGGTTAAALEVLRREDWAGVMTRAVLAARDRGIELGRD
jgi:pyrroline-5-carboxylate reductase